MKVWYSKHDVVGITRLLWKKETIRIKDRSDPFTWLKVKWKVLRLDDTGKLQLSCFWVSKSDFIRFCNGKRAAGAKIKEV
jgi:hypothetical protein